MDFQYTEPLEKYALVGGGLEADIYHVTSTVVVKAIRTNKNPPATAQCYDFCKEVEFYKRLNSRQDRCQEIIECFLVLPDHIFLSYCTHKAMSSRFFDRQERVEAKDNLRGRVVKLNEYEDPALIARWIQQLASALEFIEKMGFCHNDLHASNCLLDSDFNLKLTDFGRAITIGQLLEGIFPPRALPIFDGPLQGSRGLCSARTEQFALGTLLYLMVYGHEPYEDLELSIEEWDRFGKELEFPKLNRNEVFDGLISACWYNV
ncbi:uncharacterized protein N7483_005482 [Penicillium malachiteum]|uniref:uncharacterized protein n=1 Tax=Penicillium malachiteum TaxID=1324776 RepID=UPI002547169D|nr:uncharacterized protein N7483_005482 [Penicillium malachiteum]KAJ5730974.1 hypothetical protein N7483_005482 [Penicillium malachiteum]